MMFFMKIHVPAMTKMFFICLTIQRAEFQTEKPFMLVQ